VTPLLRPDMLFFLPLLVAYLGILFRRQQRSEAETRTQWREYAATAEVLAVERERQRVAESLQASLLRPLAALNDQLEGLASAALGALPESAVERVRKARQHSRKALYTADELIEELQAAPLREMGLVEAIQTRADMMAERQGVQIDVQTADLPRAMTEQQEIVLYHVADQALSHVAHHSGVQQIHLRLAVVDQFVALTIHDDGQCQCHLNQNGHSDLASLETCTKLIGGHFCFDMQQEGGNTLAVWLPCGPRLGLGKVRFRCPALDPSSPKCRAPTSADVGAARFVVATFRRPVLTNSVVSARIDACLPTAGCPSSPY
jgi:signal transduction histidine kinase